MSRVGMRDIIENVPAAMRRVAGVEPQASPRTRPRQSLGAPFGRPQPPGHPAESFLKPRRLSWTACWEDSWC
jgi:hypothetical protein